MTEYVTWKPERDDHKPPFWQDGMAWDCYPFRPGQGLVMAGEPSWFEGHEYRVPPEAVNGPPITHEAFLSWARANPDKAMEIAKQAQEPERDWAEAVFRDAYAAWDPLKGNIDAAAELIRTHCRPREIHLSDEQLHKWRLRMVNSDISKEVETLRSIILEACKGEG